MSLPLMVQVLCQGRLLIEAGLDELQASKPYKPLPALPAGTTTVNVAVMVPTELIPQVPEPQVSGVLVFRPTGEKVYDVLAPRGDGPTRFFRARVNIGQRNGQPQTSGRENSVCVLRVVNHEHVETYDFAVVFQPQPFLVAQTGRFPCHSRNGRIVCLTHSAPQEMERLLNYTWGHHHAKFQPHSTHRASPYQPTGLEANQGEVIWYSLKYGFGLAMDGKGHQFRVAWNELPVAEDDLPHLVPGQRFNFHKLRSLPRDGKTRFQMEAVGITL